MARIVKEDEYTARRKEILDAAQRFVYTKGYEQMTIQDILNDLGVSKGAFYHYFNSKGEVLEALVERMVAEDVLPIIIPIVHDPNLSAIDKMERYFDTGFRWKTAQKDFMLRLLRVWLADENAIVRQKMFATSVKQITPSLAEIIRQGVQEGVFTTAYPDQLSHAIIYLLQGLGDMIIELLIANETNPDPSSVETTVLAYTNALSDTLERVLGAPPGSLRLIAPDALKQWFLPAEEALPAPGLASV